MRQLQHMHNGSSARMHWWHTADSVKFWHWITSFQYYDNSTG